jgi:hypothetical protein
LYHINIVGATQGPTFDGILSYMNNIAGGLLVYITIFVFIRSMIVLYGFLHELQNNFETSDSIVEKYID